MSQTDATVGAAFPHDQDYRALNHGPHPVIPPRLSAPALNWHIATWNPRDGTSPQQWHERLANLVIGIFNNSERLAQSHRPKDGPPWHCPLSLNGRQLADMPADETHTLLNYRIERRPHGWSLGEYQSPTNPFRFETASIALLWSGQLVKLNLEIHSEYTTFTFWMPVFRMAFAGEVSNGPEGVLCDGIQANAIRKDLSAVWMYIVNDALPQHRDAFLSAMKITIDSDSTMLRSVDSFDNNAPQYRLFEGVWQELSRDLFPDMVPKSIGDRNPLLIRSFADFRSIVLPSQVPFCARDGLGWRRPLNPFDAKTASKIVSKLSNFFSRESASRSEVTGSLFLDGRVAYVSSLGSQAGSRSGTRITRHEEVGRSTRFAMITQPMTRWQLGRLVERLNTLGTLRLAALRDLEKLNEVSKGVREIGIRLDQYRRSEKKVFESEMNVNKLDQWAGEISTFRAKFSGLGASEVASPPGERVEKATVSDVRGIEGGVGYRIERSRYYVRRFESLEKSLRISRVEGFQPYDEFVRRRYYGTWDRIDRLGERYRRLQQRIEESASELVALEQSRQTNAIRESTKAQVDLLTAAEEFAIAPISYYAGSLLVDVFHAFHLNTGSHGIVPALFVAAVYAAILSRRGHNDKINNQKRSRRWLLLSIVLSCTGVALMWKLPLPANEDRSILPKVQDVAIDSRVPANASSPPWNSPRVESIRSMNEDVKSKKTEEKK